MSAPKSINSDSCFAYLDTIPLPIVISDPDTGIILYANQEFGTVFGYDTKKIRENPTANLYQNPDEWTTALKIIREKGKIENYEISSNHEDGSFRWILLSAGKIQLENGLPVLLSTLTDITGRKHAEATLQESATLYQTVFNSSPIMFWVKDTNNSILRVNQAAADLEGVNPDELAGKSSYDVYPPEQAEAFYQNDLEVIKSGQPKLGIIEQHTAVGTGKVVWLETGKIPIYNAEGEITGVMAFAVDITKSKQAEEALPTGETRFRSFFEGSTDAYLLLENGIFTDCNQAAVEMLRASSKQEVLSMSPSQFSPEFQLDGRPSGEKADEMIQIALEQGSNRFEWIHRNLDGEDFLVEVLLTPIQLGNRIIIHTVWRDISDRKKLESEIQESLERRGEQVEITTQVAQEIAVAKDINSIFERVVTLVKERFDYYHAQIFRYNPLTDAMQLVTGYGKIGEKMCKAGHNLAVGQGVVGTAAATRQPTLATNVAQDRDWRPNPFLPETKGELAVPIKFQDEVLGILDVQSDRAGALTQDDVLLLENLAGQIAIAIENTRLRDEMEVRIEEIESLYRSVSKVGSATSTEEISMVFVPEKRSVEQGMNQWLEKIEKSITNGSAILEKPEDDQGLPLTVVPLNMRGEIVGTLGIQPDDLHEFSQEDLEMLETVSEQVTQALENAQLFQETQRQARETELLNRIVTGVSQSLDLQENLQLVADEICKIVSALHVGIALISDTKTELVLVADSSTSDSNLNGDIGASLPIQGNPTAELVLNSGKPLFINDVENNPVTAKIKDLLKPRGTKSLFIWPISVSNEVVGSIGIDFAEPDRKLKDSEISLIEAILLQTSTAVQNARLFEEVRKFRLGLEQSADAVFMTDINGTILYANPAFTNIYGYTPDEVIGKNPRILKSGLLSKEDYRQFWEALLAKNTVSREIINKAKDGHLVPIADTNSPILDEKEDILGFLAIHTDITKRKADEEALQRRNEYLAASAEIGRLVTSTLDLEAIFTRSVNLIVERFGFYYASIFIIEETGFNAFLREATGKAGQLLKESNHSLSVGSSSTVGKATNSGEVVVINNTALDSLHRHNPLLPETKAEATVPLKIGNRIIGALDIQATEVDAFSEDEIAILQLLADQIAVGIDNARSYNLAQQAVEEMREVDRLKSQFLANMSHELRTPLNSIIGFARVILKGIDGPITDLQQQDLTAIFNSGQHLLGLINDILDLSRIEAGKMELTFDEVNMAELISSVMSTATGLIKDKPIALKREIPEDLPLVRADAMRVRQVLINFLSNAAKFTEEGEIVVKARIEESKKGQSIVIVSVTDTGPGVALEDQSKLFQPFSQVDASLTRKVGGTGLGLSICQHLIQMHGGQIGIQSDVGQGSTFYFSMPVFQARNKAEGIDNNRVILAIDDDPQIISLYERYLEPKGFQVIGLSDPSKTKERVEQLKPFAITLDIMMPGYDGWQVLTDLKSSSETRDVPVIICSIVEDEDKGFSLGAADYLIKPILEEDLLSALDRLNGDGSIREVLVIDDDPNDLRLLGKMIAEQGKYKAVLAEGGPAGWSIISSKAPHAIVLDLFMPEMDGFTILEKMRRDKKLRDVPVIVITGADLTTDQKKQLDNLGKRLLQKSSLNEHELIETVENALQRVRSN